MRDLLEGALYLHEDELVLSHHAHGFCLDEGMLVSLEKFRFFSMLEVKLLLQFNVFLVDFIVFNFQLGKHCLQVIYGSVFHCLFIEEL